MTLPVWQIAVGDELLSGRTSDTNSRDVQRILGEHGVVVRQIAVVPDEIDAIRTALDRTEPGGLVVLTGGLGSTPDDLTRDAVAGWAGVDLQLDATVLSRLHERFRRLGIACGTAVERQAEVPEGMTPLDNPQGSAPGLVGELAGRTVVMLPGVPGELRALLPGVRDALVARGVLPPPLPRIVLRTAQMGELTLAEACRPVRREHPELRWSWRLTRWGVDLTVATTSDLMATSVAELLAEVRLRLLDRLEPSVYAEGSTGLNEVVQQLMVARGETLGVAESCTAGLLGARLTELSGSSRFFRGGLLTYADRVKRSLLGVPADILASCGAVSRETAEAMAAACRRLLETDYALAITGISGPDGGSAEKPVGTTWICAATPTALHARCYRFPSHRRRNRQLAVAVALDTMRRLLADPDNESPWHANDTWGIRP